MRFRREAQAVAALNHPGIVTIHSFEESGGVHLLTMELVDGETWTELIPHDGLPLSRTLDMAIQLTQALAAAHARGIVHRDIKPGNLMTTPSGVKILDFGWRSWSTRATDRRSTPVSARQTFARYAPPG